MEITSIAFENGTDIHLKYTCEGPNRSTPLSFSDIPDKAKSLILMVEYHKAKAKPCVHSP
ncbi:MAG: hypothetical protein M3Q58_09080 [Bacteroidota bacterium]|nr:hypothetical protein [Bacteroidota bacterium]